MELARSQISLLLIEVHPVLVEGELLEEARSTILLLVQLRPLEEQQIPLVTMELFLEEGQ